MQVILWVAAIVNIPRYAGAFIYADLAEVPDWLSDWMNWANLVSGIAMGIVEAGAIALIMDGLRQTSLWSKTGLAGMNWKWIANLIFGLGMMIIAIFILVPFMNARMNAQQMREILPSPFLQAAWNLFIVLAPIFIIAGASFAQTDLVGRKFVEEKPENAGNSSQVTGSLPQDWRKMTKEQKKKLAGKLRSNPPQGKREVQEEYGVSEKTADNWYNNLVREGFLQ